jgi:hypothetical protein
MNILRNCIRVRNDSQAHSVSLDWRKTIFVASQFFAFLHSLGQERPIGGAVSMSACPTKQPHRPFAIEAVTGHKRSFCAAEKKLVFHPQTAQLRHDIVSVGAAGVTPLKWFNDKRLREATFHNRTRMCGGSLAACGARATADDASDRNA